MSQASATGLRRVAVLGFLGLISIFILVSIAAGAMQHDYVYQSAWGSFGDQAGQFNTPAGVAVNGGSIYVADSANHRVQEFAPDGSLLAVWGGLGSAPGRMNHPWGIAVSSSKVFVADRDNGRVQVFGADGAFVTAWSIPGAAPTGIAISDSTVYLTDTNGQRVLVYTTNGTFVRQWGSYGALYGQFYDPWGVTVAADGTIYVVDRGNHRIQHFSADGQFLDAFGSYGSRCYQFDAPAFIAMAANGNILVTDQPASRVRELTPEGGCVTWWGVPGSGTGQMRSPLGIALDTSGHLYLADSGNHRLLSYVYRDLPMSHRVYLPLILKDSRPYFEARVNAGDDSYVDSQGKIWRADQQYSPGGWGYIERASNVFTTTEPIDGSNDQSLYQSERYNMAGYAFDVPNGFYDVTLKFAEILYDREDKRVFGVNIEGSRVITDLDIFATAGKDRAYDRTFSLPVADGQLNIDFIPKRYSDAPKISAIAFIQLSEETVVTPTPTPPAQRTVTFAQGVDGYQGGQDTFIDFYAPARNMEGSQTLAIRPYRDDQGRAALLRFDVASIPADATVLTASLSVHVNSRTNANALYVGAYRLLRPWKAKEATWISATQQVAWQEAGANGSSGDRAAGADDVAAMDSDNTWYTFTVQSLVQSWLAQPDQNLGLILQGAPGGAVEYTVNAGESGRQDLRPRLTVVYSTLPQSATRTPTMSPTASPTRTASPTPTVTPTATPTSTPSLTPTPTATPSVTVVVMQQGSNGYAGAEDTYISQWVPAANYAGGAVLYLRSNDLLAPLLRFDVSAIPSDAEIEDASLSLYAYYSSNPNLLVADIYGVRRAWTVSETTWLSATGAITWTVPGCNGLGIDRDATATDVQGFDAYGYWYTFTVKSLVQAWVQNPQSNDGMVIKGRPGDAVQFSFWSSNSSSFAQRPILTVTYRRRETQPSPGPGG